MIKYFGYIIFCFFIATLTVRAQDSSSDASALGQKIDSLQKKIFDLEKRVASLEKDKANNLAKKGNYKIRENWLELQNGMTKKQVKELLGEPGKKLTGVGEYWYYPDSFGGRVEFNDDGIVAGWKEP
jgi:hypothetical protein